MSRRRHVGFPSACTRPAPPPIFMFKRVPSLLALLIALPLTPLAAKPFSDSTVVDFFRDVPSRNLKGLAARSDGRLLAGPVLQPLTGALGAELLWDLEPAGPDRWLLATGPEGRILEVTVGADEATLTARVWAEVGPGQVYALRALPDGRVVAGASPRGRLLVLDATGQKLAETTVPADSIFDLHVRAETGTLLVATGNPGRIFEFDLATLVASEPAPAPPAPPADATGTEAAAAAGGDASAPVNVAPTSAVTPLVWTDRGGREFGRIRDRNVRRLALATDGAVLAGSSPDGNLYRFPAAGGEPIILLDQDRAEITDLHVDPDNGDIFAAVVFTATAGNARVVATARVAAETQSTDSAEPTDAGENSPTILEPGALDQFPGRSSLILLPRGDGLPETVAARNNVAFYRIVPRGNLLLLAGGDNGELLGYDRTARRSLTFAGSPSAQLTDLTPTAEPDRYLLMTNNPAGLTLIDFAGAGPRSAETRRLDLRTPATFGALRFDRIRELDASAIGVTVRANRASDPLEGWTAWTDATGELGGWTAPGLTGQFAQIRVTVPETAPRDLEIDRARLHFLPQNRRPVLQGFRIVSPNYGLVPRNETPSPVALTLGQVIGANNSAGDERRNAANFLASPVVPLPGAQLVTWTVNDADEDVLATTFSVRHEHDADWTDLAHNVSGNWLQFDRATLRDGLYFTRLTVAEQSPRPAADRLTVTFETDDLLIDRVAPVITAVEVERRDSGLYLEIAGEDALTLLTGVKLVFNHGYEHLLEQPADGILDSRAERFVMELPLALVGTATAVEVRLSDSQGNTAAQRVTLP